MPRPKRDSPQRATRNTFIQKGAEVQKIDQGGIWARIIDSYPNAYFDSTCFEQEVANESEFVSVAKWVYRCKRLIRLSGHTVVSIRNGEILEPCYFVEPSIEERFEAGTLVWLEPLPQLNGYVFVPGGIPRCYPIYPYYGSYGSGSGYFGSDSGYFGSDSGYFGSGSGYLGSGSGIGSGSGLVDCSALLNCLCVQKDSQGRVTGVFVKNPDGSLTEIMECSSGSGSGSEGGSGSGSEGGSGSGSGGGGGGGGGCCDPGDTAYVVEYNITVNGRTYSGVTGEDYWFNMEYYNSATHSNSSCSPPFIFIYFFIGCLTGYPATLEIVCGLDNICSLRAPDDLYFTAVGCPDLPTFYVTILPDRCASGSFVLRPA